MSCQFLFRKAKRCWTGKAMTCAASVQMVGSFSFVIPAQELFTEVMTWFIADRRFYQNNPPENLYIDRHISKRVKGILIKHWAQSGWTLPQTLHKWELHAPGCPFIVLISSFHAKINVLGCLPSWDISKMRILVIFTLFCCYDVAFWCYLTAIFGIIVPVAHFFRNYVSYTLSGELL
jgi:hypothetical protein